MNKIIKQILILVFLTAVLLLPYFVFAGQADKTLKELNDVAGKGGYKTSGISDTTMAGIVGTAITALLSLIGVIFLALMVYAGFLWMTARGEEEKVTKAKDIITMAIIGLIIVVAAYAITYFVYTYVIFESGTLK